MLSGVSLQLASLREQPLLEGELQARLAETHDLVRQCLGELRELITRNRPLTLDASHLPEALADEARRFERDTGIRTQCVCHGTPPRLADEAGAQIVRIAQEALTNVRRHSGAANVAVVLVCNPTQVHLIVDDDGRGFPFAGRWEHEQLERTRRGPLVIRERVRLLGGTLLIVSAPGSGARVEVTIPSPARA
jgi:signal transduction histidine kinase